MYFRDREQAGRHLSYILENAELHDPLVLGILRGGVVVAAALAPRLNAELDVVLARKLRAPYHGELAMGAIAEGGRVFLNEYAKLLAGALKERIDPEIDKQT